MNRLLFGRRFQSSSQVVWPAGGEPIIPRGGIRATVRHVYSVDLYCLRPQSLSQAVRLPKQMALPEGIRRVEVFRLGHARVIVPFDPAWDDFFDDPGVSEDFMAEFSPGSAPNYRAVVERLASAKETGSPGILFCLVASLLLVAGGCELPAGPAYSDAEMNAHTQTIQRIKLPPLSAAEHERIAGGSTGAGSTGGGTPLQRGIGRAIPESERPIRPAALSWTEAEGGERARITVVSPGAAGLRLGLRIAGKCPLTLHLSGENGPIVGTYRAGEIQRPDSGLWWSPPVAGDTLDMVLERAPATELDSCLLTLERVSHLH